MDPSEIGPSLDLGDMYGEKGRFQEAVDAYTFALTGEPHNGWARASVHYYRFLLTDDPATLLYVAVLLARRLDATNRALIEVKRQIQTGQPRSIISRTVEKAEELLNYSGGINLVYAGYPYDPHDYTAS